MEQHELICTREGAVAVVTLNRPDVLNALNASLSKALSTQLQELEFDDSVRCVVITGRGAGFMAGGDIGMFARYISEEPQARQAHFHTFIQQAHPLIASIKRMPKPVIACVNGVAAGFGMSLMMACDFVIAGRSSVFTMAYIQLGLSPDGGGTYFLPRLVGLRKAMELALLSDRITGDEAKAFGLVNWVVPDEDLAEETQKLATRLAQGPTHAYANTKRLLSQSFENTLAQQLSAEEESFAKCTATIDFPEGAQSFMEKRQPHFHGK